MHEYASGTADPLYGNDPVDVGESPDSCRGSTLPYDAECAEIEDVAPGLDLFGWAEEADSLA